MTFAFLKQSVRKILKLSITLIFLCRLRSKKKQQTSVFSCGCCELNRWPLLPLFRVSSLRTWPIVAEYFWHMAESCPLRPLLRALRQQLCCVLGCHRWNKGDHFARIPPLQHQFTLGSVGGRRRGVGRKGNQFVWRSLLYSTPVLLLTCGFKASLPHPDSLLCEDLQKPAARTTQAVQKPLHFVQLPLDGDWWEILSLSRLSLCSQSKRDSDSIWKEQHAWTERGRNQRGPIPWAWRTLCAGARLTCRQKQLLRIVLPAWWRW